jgi:hypothetical protein
MVEINERYDINLWQILVNQGKDRTVIWDKYENTGKIVMLSGTLETIQQKKKLK